jgi:NitT/TauT family transport system substrate-binding protein
MRRPLSLAALLLVALAPRAADAAVHQRILVPDSDNLQYLAFWVAQGAGYFEEEGLAVDLVIPERPALAQSYFERGETDVAVLSPPMYLRLVAEGYPFALVANILRNDPIDLIVRRRVAEERGIHAGMSLHDRLAALRGITLGVAPGPPTRLRVLFAGVGLDADRDLKISIIHGAEQNAAFAEGRVDALYAHTPYLETALEDQDAVVVVDQSGGEIPALAARQIHALAATRAFLRDHPDRAAGMARAIYRAERLVHTDPAATAAAVLHALPHYEPKKVARLVALYTEAVPETPHVSPDGFAQALALYPASGQAPDFGTIDRAAYIDTRFADEAVARERGAQSHTWLLRIVITLGLTLALVIAVMEMLPKRSSSNPRA